MMLPRPVHHEAGDVLVQRKVPVRLTPIWRFSARAASRRPVTENPGVVHEHVDATVRLARPRHHRLDLRLVSDVADDAQRVATPPLDGLRALHRIVRIDVHAHDARALVGQSLGDPPADVRTRPRHDHDLAGKAAHSRSFLMPRLSSCSGLAAIPL
jgi:hypothetical protein